jgi:ApbE superfamily uncharacterized protein (UPF0280 family)
MDPLWACGNQIGPEDFYSGMTLIKKREGIQRPAKTDRGSFLFGMNRWQRHHFEYRESIITFLCEEDYLEAGEQALKNQRKILESFIREFPDFRTTHVPFYPEEGVPDLIGRMCIQSQKAGVGPMASVAGALAFEALNAMLEAGAPEAVVDNGGDIALFIREPVRIGIFAGLSPLNTLALEVKPRTGPFGICTSSGVVGRSFSYGKANAAMVISSDVILADAAATALGNRVQQAGDLETCFYGFSHLAEIEGGLVIFQDRIALWGELPELIRAHDPTHLITMGKESF